MPARVLPIACGILLVLAFSHMPAGEPSAPAQAAKDPACSGATVMLTGGSLLVPTREAGGPRIRLEPVHCRVLPVGLLTLTADSVTKFNLQAEAPDSVTEGFVGDPYFVKR